MKGIIVFLSTFAFLCTEAVNESKSNKEKISWRNRDMRDMTDVDLERLSDEWEKNDDPLEPDELPEYLRPSPKIDISKIDMTNPDNVLRMTKRGKGVMMFVDVNKDISPEQADVVMRIWQSSLQNNHIITERYSIDSKRAVFLFREGSQAVDAKDYLIQQPELSHVTLEGQIHYGKYAEKNAAQETKQEQSKTRDNKRAQGTRKKTEL